MLLPSCRLFVLLIVLTCLAGHQVAFAQKVPDGFKAELLYGVPEIEHPSVVTCDDVGNLFVGEDPMDMRGPTNKEFDRVLYIVFDQEGKPVRKTVFCENLSAVFGLIWHEGALYVMHAPHYTMFKDTDGDGVADVRKDLADGFGPTPGIHGFNDHVVTGTRMGLDGRVYISVGDTGIQKATGNDGSSITLEGGGVVRMTLDGRQLEIVTSGTRNHLDVAMDSLDNIFTYDNTDDGLGWWTRFTLHVPSGYYGYPYDYHTRTDRHLPRISEHGGGSPVGGACYREAAWPKKYVDSPFFCEWGKGKIQFFKLKKKGASFEAEIEDFMVKEGTEEFRPLDLCFSPDGRHMYVADWNYSGWVNKKQAGRLFRVTYVGTDVTSEPARAPQGGPFESYVKSLGHPSHAERMRAMFALAAWGGDQPKEAFNMALKPSVGAPKVAKIHAIWLAEQLASRPENAYYSPVKDWLQALKDAEPDVRAQAARALGLRRAAQAIQSLSSLLKDDSDPAVRLQAAIALGRIGNPTSDIKWLSVDSGQRGVILPRIDETTMAPLGTGDTGIAHTFFLALGDEDDYVRHVVIQSLRTVNNWGEAPKSLRSESLRIRQATLLALTGSFDESAVAVLRDFVLGAAGPASAEELAKAVEAVAEVHRRSDPYTKGWWGTQPAKGQPARPRKNDWSGTVAVLATLRDAAGSVNPAVKIAAIKAWRDVIDPAALPILRTLTAPGNDREVRREAVTTLATLKDKEVISLFASIAGDAASEDALRQEAVKGITAIGSPEAIEQLVKIVAADASSEQLTGLAFESLATLKPEGAIAVTERRLSDSRASVRSAAAKALGAIRGSSASTPLIPLLNDPDLAVSKNVLATLGQVKSPDAVPAMILAATNPALKFEAQQALAMMPDRRALPLYLDGLVSPNNDLRKSSLDALAALRNVVGPDIIKLHELNELPNGARGPLQAVFSAPAPIQRWQLAGPFPKEGEFPKFDVSQAADLQQEFAVGDQRLKWKEVSTTDKQGRFNAGNLLGSSGDMWAMAYAAIEADSDGPRSLVLGSDDQAVLFVNGQQVYEFLGNRGWGAEQGTISVDLKKGINHVWFKTGNTGGGWEFSLAVRTREAKYAFLYENVVPKLDIGAYSQFATKNAGNAVRGKVIFEDPKGVACAKCHSVGGVGGKIGPDLIGIAAKYPREELIRSVLEPSNRIANGYDVYVVVTNSGVVFNGLLKSESPEGVELLDGKRDLHKIAASEIEEKSRSLVSLMPNGLKDGLTLEDFADIIAYLDSLKQQPTGTK